MRGIGGFGLVLDLVIGSSLSVRLGERPLGWKRLRCVGLRRNRGGWRVLFGGRRG